MSVLQPVVDDNGNLILHGRQGIVLTLEFYNSDGTLRDMTGKTVTFECGTTLNINLAVVGGAPWQMTLTLTNANVKTIAALADRQFVVIDNSTTQPTPVWAGTVYIVGWTE